MAIAEFSISPTGKGESVSEYVARCVDLIDRSGLPYRLNPMGTVVEGPLEEIMALILRCHQAVSADCDRVSTIIKIDDRKGAANQIVQKVDKIERILGRKLRT
ncbi:MAG TPA: MTH1187 family thiamine-binding protein [Thermoplasmata archaeon]|nr:MTH1187 family thiamine-binding protein [Thermoplasmata archaeon]